MRWFLKMTTMPCTEKKIYFFLVWFNAFAIYYVTFQRPSKVEKTLAYFQSCSVNQNEVPHLKLIYYDSLTKVLAQWTRMGLVLINSTIWFVSNFFTWHLIWKILLVPNCYLSVAESTWDIPYLNRKIFLFCYQIFKSDFFCH